MDKDVYIVSDVHGNWRALEKALLNADIDFSNSFIVQLGDLGNYVADSVEDDIECLKYVGREIDLMLVDNHGIPYFDPQNRFSGFHWNVVIDERLRSLNEMGLIQPSFVHGDTLITHAGLTASLIHTLGPSGYDAFSVDLKLRNEWKAGNFQHMMFSSIGRARYGPDSCGGIVWCDFEKEFEPTSFPQIVGHTARGLQQKGNALCIDTIRHTGRPTILKIGG